MRMGRGRFTGRTEFFRNELVLLFIYFHLVDGGRVMGFPDREIDSRFLSMPALLPEHEQGFDIVTTVHEKGT